MNVGWTGSWWVEASGWLNHFVYLVPAVVVFKNRTRIDSGTSRHQSAPTRRCQESHKDRTSIARSCAHWNKLGNVPCHLPRQQFASPHILTASNRVEQSRTGSISSLLTLWNHLTAVSLMAMIKTCQCRRPDYAHRRRMIERNRLITRMNNDLTPIGGRPVPRGLLARCHWSLAATCSNRWPR